MISSFASAAAKIQRHILLRPESTSIDFEMAYKVRAAIDKIKFSIKQIESSEPATDSTHEALFQLLGALDLLRSADVRFQDRFHLMQNTVQRSGAKAERVD
jgi:hypothetical protein